MKYKTKRAWYASPEHYKSEKSWGEYKASQRLKRRRRTYRQPQGYGLFSASDIGFAAPKGQSIGSFDFGGAFGGTGKTLTPKQQFLSERKQLNQRLENQRYSAKLQDIRAAKSRLDAAERQQMVENVKQGVSKVKQIVKRKWF